MYRDFVRLGSKFLDEVNDAFVTGDLTRNDGCLGTDRAVDVAIIATFGTFFSASTMITY